MSRVKDVNRADILHFLAAIYYMGLVRLPSKDDYFAPIGIWPVHHTIRLSQNWFQYIWRNFHTTHKPEDADQNEQESDEEEEEEGDEPIQEPLLPNDDEDDRWYSKVGTFVDHIRKVSKKICIHPGFALSIDEMMKKFKGRSHYTHRMKNKPIKEGDKFFAICDAKTGYVFDFLPDGRGEKGRTILKHVFDLIKSIPRRNTLKYVVAMDNYFTTPNVMKESRELNVGVVGTARGRSGWPPKELNKVEDMRFNTLHLMNDKENFLIGRWIDNNVVKMVSTVHRGGNQECVERERRQPRTTATNKGHVQEVWGPNPTKLIHIPQMIDDYNHWMGGVDKTDQYISYYRPNLRCRRVWMPIFLHGMDIVRVNSFVAVKKILERQHAKVTQKKFVAEFISSLNDRAASFQHAQSRRAAMATAVATGQSKQKRRRMSTKCSLPDDRFKGLKEDHMPVVLSDSKQKACIYCSYKRMKAKKEGVTNLPSVSNVKRICSYCKVNLCAPCFSEYHQNSE